MSLSPAAGPVQPHPLYALQRWLYDNHYSPWCTERITRHAEEHGELAGAVAVGLLDREDEATATEVYVEAMPEIRQCAAEWEDGSIYIDVDTLLEAGRPINLVDRLVPPELDPEPFVPTEEDELFAAAMAAADPELPPIAGGAPDDGPRTTDNGQRTEEDWAEYREWAERTDRLEGLLRDLPEDPQYGYE